MQHIRSGDEVIILTGRDKKRRGIVLKRVSLDRVLVEGINMVKKHIKPNPMANQPGGIIEKPASIHISNVAIFNPETGARDRVVIKEIEGRKVRTFRSNGARVDRAKVSEKPVIKT